MIDIHCHILPEIDDGPKTKEEAIKMSCLAVDSGTDIVFATPHFMNGVFTTDLMSISIKTKAFSNTLKHSNIPLAIFEGAEIRISSKTAEMMSTGELPGLGQTRYYLIELPSTFIKEGVLRIVRQMVDMGGVPIIAHPERNYMIMKQPELIDDLLDAGVRFQLTGKSVTGKNDRISFKISRQMIMENKAHYIASDGHDLYYRPPRLDTVFKILKKSADEKTAKKLLIENPKEIVDQALNTNFALKEM